ncbi:MAG: LacI family DNA-binding transcriptional regulator, partial [[Actinobacillus] rossii]|nr:LacI family DNA-binding transcriptional regulator [[Actinobacillus] rossii]
MATIKDVAKLAGVSTTTVSPVINETRHVAAE